jgi:hypothetical protein
MRAGGAPEPAERELHEEVLESIQTQLDEESFAACWDQGQKMTFPEALAEMHGPALSM